MRSTGAGMPPQGSPAGAGYRLRRSRLPREQFSEVPFFWAIIAVPYPGASAEDIEKTVTVPIETEMSGLDKLDEIVSLTQQGSSIVHVQFDSGVSNREFDRLYQEVQTRFSKVSLPPGTLKPVIDDFSSADFLPVIEVIVSGKVEYSVLSRTARLLQERLRRLPEVSGAKLVGARDRQIVIGANEEKLEAAGICLEEIVRAVRSQAVTIPGGTLETQSREYILRTVGELQRAREFEKLIVRRGAPSGGLGGAPAASGALGARAAGVPASPAGVVYLSDVAEVREAFDPRGVDARFNAEQAILINITKAARGNSVAVVNNVKAVVEEFRQTLPPGMNISLAGDSTVQIRQNLSVLQNNALMGLVLLVFILLLFIGVRNALIVALGMPVSFALTFVILELSGQTFNTNTLFALVLVLGLIVDHAIVIIENSYRLQQEGYSRIDSAIQGTNQVAVPVIAATLTTVAAFLPLMILPGTIGKFLRVIPLTVTIALLVSTAESLVFLPVHFAEWSAREHAVRQPGRRLFERFKAWFGGVASAVFRRRYAAVPAALGALVGSFALVPTLRQDLFSAEDFSLFYIDIELPAGSPQSRTHRLVPFSTVAAAEETPALAAVRRVDGKREVTVSSEAFDTSGVPGINAAIRRMFEERLRPLYRGVSLVVGGEFSEVRDLLVQILRIFLVGIFLIYLILGAQFKSYLQPALILLTVPFAFAGVVIYLAVSATPFSTTVLYAGVALAGIAVNDSIVLVSYINDLRRQGKSVAEAVAEGVTTRLRPILLTSLTTIAGLLPTALGLGGKSVVWQPMASTIIFGLVFSTLTALLVIPGLYGIIEDLRARVRRGRARPLLAEKGHGD